MRTDWKAFLVEGVPVPKPVGPYSKRAGPAWDRYYAWRTAIGFKANRHFPAPLAGAVELSVVFYLPASRSLLDHRGDRQRAAADEITPIGKPDLKNLIAAVEDSLTGIAWADDAQVVSYGFSRKQWSTDGHPRAFIVVEPLPRGLAQDRVFKGYPHSRHVEPVESLG